MIATTTLPFIDLAAQRRALEIPLREAIDAVFAHDRYILGPEVGLLETELAEFCGARHAVTCANGTDALVLALRALRLPAGAAVICPSFTFCATAEAIVLAGGTPVFADVSASDFNLDPQSVLDAVTLARESGLQPAGIIAVDLFGLPADYSTLQSLASEQDMWIIADAAQSFGAARGGRVGTHGSMTTTSFFPAKPLGCYGDGGAIMCDDGDTVDLLRSLRGHGAGADRYEHVRIGTNSRLDTLQAAILRVKLGAFTGELASRQSIAERYAAGLGDLVEVPRLPDGATSSWAQYTVLLEAGERSAVRAALSDKGIPTAVYYERPMHRQEAYSGYLAAAAPCTEELAERVLSLPMHPYLAPADQERIVAVLRRSVGRVRAR